MLALLPENIEVQILRKIAAVAALCLPTLVQSEVIEFTCTRVSDFASDDITLQFDTTNQQVKLGEAEWSDNSIWGQVYITWAVFFDLTVFASAGSGVWAYMFERSTGKLVADGVSPNNFYDAAAGTDFAMHFECRRPF